MKYEAELWRMRTTDAQANWTPARLEQMPDVPQDVHRPRNAEARLPDQKAQEEELMILCPRCEKPMSEHERPCENKHTRRFFFGLMAGIPALAVAPVGIAPLIGWPAFVHYGTDLRSVRLGPEDYEKRRESIPHLCPDGFEFSMAHSVRDYRDLFLGEIDLFYVRKGCSLRLDGKL